MTSTPQRTAMRFRFVSPGATWVLLTCVVGSITTLDILPVTKTTDPGKDVDAPSVTLSQLNDAYDKAVADMNSRREIEDHLPPSGIIPPTSKAAEARHQRQSGFDQITADADLNATLLLSGSEFLKQKLRLSNVQATSGLKKVPFPPGSKWDNTIKQCQQLFQPVSCDQTFKYRTPDGTCNNLEHPNWGKSHSCFGRVLQPEYNDGLSEPRKSKSNKDLPSVRKISLEIHEALVTPNAGNTHMVMQFGQFLTHDISMGLMTRTITNKSMLFCCPVGESKVPECSLAIGVPKNDKDFFNNNGQDCINFVRSALCNDECNFGPRGQGNRVTPYLDSSNVYGSSKTDMDDVRSYQDGLLISQMVSSEEYLPYSKSPTTDQCSTPEKNLRCFRAGDKRVNQQPGLSSLHTLFLRHHNRLARLFKASHPDYDDEQLYQLTRRVVNAHYQNIVFSEFLTAVFGPKYMNYFSLETGSNSVYQPDLEATIFNEFMTSALRFGHTLIQNTLERGSGTNSSFNLDEVYFTPYILMQGELDPVLKGLANQPGKLFERHLVTAVTHTLYRQKESAVGMDLASLNIQRGRDHGTASYTKYIKHCFNKTITTFEELDIIMSKQNRKNLKSIYESPDDIDLFTGGVSEDKLPDASVGPTLACIMGIQFNRLKFGDRFYFEHKDQIGSFTDAQLKEIRQVSFAHIICKNTKTVEEIVPNVFNLASKTNKLTQCVDIPDFDHTLF